MFNWPKRTRHWIGVVRRFSNAEPWPVRAWAICVGAWKMARALASGPVPLDVWRDRIRTCAKCPARSVDGWVCYRRYPSAELGCRCDLALLCLTAAPGKHGCWAREITHASTEQQGWPNYVRPKRTPSP